MNVTMLKGAHDYLVIKTPEVDLSVLLDRDISVPASLAASALQMRDKASKLIRRAELIEEAAKQLAGDANG